MKNPDNALANVFTTSHAFIIGINEYEHFSPLNNAVRDALGVADVLREPIHGYTVHPPLLNASASAVLDLVEQQMPALVGPGDRVLFYFAGHGVAQDSEQDGTPEGFILPRDARSDNTDHFISMVDLRKAFSQLSCRHFLLILDCCFSGAIRWGTSDKRSLRLFPKKIYQERFDRFVADPAWQVLTSSAYDQEALDGIVDKPLGTSRNAAKGHSPFALHFMEALRGKADLIPKEAPDGLITVTEVYLYIRNKVEKQTLALKGGFRQTPGLFQLPKHDKGEFLFLSPEILLNLPSFDPSLNPYNGLRSYEQADAANFFGRDQVVDKLSAFFAHRRFCVVAGASGTGKSSLVKAGLFPLLAKQGYVQMIMRPGTRPLEEMSVLTSGLTRNKTVLLIDQFEELVTQCHDPEERIAFLQEIDRLLGLESPLQVIVTIRADFEPQFMDGILSPHWSDARFAVPGFTTLELREIIQRPAVQRTILFDPPQLVDHILEDVQNAPGALPLLSFAMSELYEGLKERQSFGAFRESDYLALGGVIGALRTRADELYHRLEVPHRATMQKIMLRMVSLEGGELAKRRVPLKELEYERVEENQRVTSVLQQLTEARLVVTGRARSGEPFVEPCHDALVRAWATLWGWITAIGKDKLLLLGKLADATMEHERTGHQKDLWHNNVRLDAVLEEKDQWLNRQEKIFVTVSLQLRKRQRQRLIAVLTGIIVVLTGLSIFSAIQRSNAINNQKEAVRQAGIARDSTIAAQTQRALAVENALLAQLNADTARMNAAEALTQQQLAEYRLFLSESRRLVNESQRLIAEGDLSNAVRYAQLALERLPQNLRPLLAPVLYELSGLAREGKMNLLTREWPFENGEVHRFAPTGEGIWRQSLATGKTQLYGLDGKVLHSGENGQYNAFNFSQDGQMILLSPPGRVELRSARSGALLQSFTDEDGNGYPAFGGGQRYVVTGSNTCKAIWTIDGKLLTKVGCDRNLRITGLHFSHKGDRFLLGLSEQSPEMWTIDGERLFTLEHVGSSDFEFSADDRIFLTHSSEGTKVWNAAGVLQRNLPGSKQSNSAGSFSPDGEYFILNHYPQGPQLWRTTPLAFVARLTDSSEDEVFGQDHYFSPNGRYVLVNTTGESRLWNMKGDVLADFSDGHSAVLSPDGQHIMTRIERFIPGKITVWNGVGTEIVGVIDSEGNTSQASFSPDGKSILVPENNLLRIFSLRGEAQGEIGGCPSHRPRMASTERFAIGFADCQTSRSGRLQLWSRPQTLTVPPISSFDPVLSAAFSPDGRFILERKDRRLELRDRDGSSIWQMDRRYRLGKKPLSTFSPNGQYILTVLTERDRQYLALWSIEGELVRTFGPNDDLIAATFSPGSDHLLSVENNGKIRLWNLNGKQHFNGSLGTLNVGRRIRVFYQPVLSADNRYLLIPGRKEVEIYHLSGKKALQVGGHQAQVSGALFSPDSKHFMTYAKDGSVKTWNLQGRLKAEMNGHQDAVFLGEFSPNNRTMLTAGLDDRVNLWDQSGKLLKTIEFPKRALKYSSFAPSGESFAILLKSGEIRLLSTSDGRTITLGPFDKPCTEYQFSPDGQVFAAHYEDGTIRAWDREGNLLDQIMTGDKVKWRFSPDGDRLLINTFDPAVQIWEVPDYDWLKKLKVSPLEPEQLRGFYH